MVAEMLPVVAMTEEQKACYANDNQFRATLSDGRDVVYKLPTGGDQNRFGPMLQDDNDRMLLSILMRLKKLGDAHPNDFRRELDELDMGDVVALFDEFEKNDFGVETGIEVACGSITCGAQQKVELPFGESFFSPRKSL